MESFCIPDEDLPDWAKPKTKDDPPAELKSNVYGAAKKTVFVLGITLLVFASARNSITWHFERFWGASKNIYEDIWRSIHIGLFDGDDFLLSTIGTHSFLFVYFWLNSLFFMFLDIFKPAYFMKYKIQEDAQVKMPELMKAIRVCIRNQFIGLLISVPLYFLSKARGQPSTAETLPTFHWVLFEICVYIVVEEIGFYYSHRLMHHRVLYKHIHKIHHEWTAPVSIIGIYAHPIEHIMSNLIPVFMGPFIMGSHFSCIWLWSCISISSTQVSHGGYHLPFFPSPEAHDFHHLKFTNNFGVMGVLDRFHGTDSMFVKTKAYDRHIMLIGLTPAKERFPDEEKKGGKTKKKSL